MKGGKVVNFPDSFGKKPKVGLGWSNKFGPLWYNGDRLKMLDDPGVFERGSDRPWPFESNTKTREE